MNKIVPNFEQNSSEFWTRYKIVPNFAFTKSILSSFSTHFVFKFLLCVKHNNNMCSYSSAYIHMCTYPHCCFAYLIHCILSSKYAKCFKLCLPNCSDLKKWPIEQSTQIAFGSIHVFQSFRNHVFQIRIFWLKILNLHHRTNSQFWHTFFTWK